LLLGEDKNPRELKSKAGASISELSNIIYGGYALSFDWRHWMLWRVISFVWDDQWS